MLSFVAVVRVRVKVVRFFSFFWVFFVSVLAEKNKNTTDDVDSFFSLFCDGRRRRDPQKKTTLMVFERENEREMGETLSARALKFVAAFLRAAR